MSGCANGIDTIEVKAPNGKPSILFQNLLELNQGNLDSSYRSYLKSFTSRLDNLRVPANLDANGELLASIVYDNLGGNELGAQEQFSKVLSGEEPVDTDNNNTKRPEKDSVMSRILEQARLIIDPETDANGVQSDSYGITTTPGGAATSFLGRVSNILSSFTLRKSELTDRAGNVYPTLTEAIVHREAETLFKGKGASETITFEGIDYNREEYIDFKRAVYKQGTIKGDLIHALLQGQIAYINGDTKLQEDLKKKIRGLENESSTKEGAYNWVLDKENFEAIMKNAGIVVSNKVPAELRDKVFSEVSVANPLLGAGKIDTLVEKPSGRLKIVDYKTGNRFNNSTLGARLMNYGAQEFNLYDSSLGRAKLQVMLYALIVKASNPDAQFEVPVVMHIPDEYKAKSSRNAHQVEVRDYLKMIEQFYRSEQPDVYKQLIEVSPKLFDPSEYGATINTSFTQDMLDSTGMRDIEMLQKYEVELEQLVTSVSIRSASGSNYRQGWEEAEARQRDMLMMKIAQARSTIGLPQGSSKNFEIANFTKWLGTINDTQNPYIQAYAQLVNQARLKVYQEYEDIEGEFDNKLTKVLEEKLGKRSNLEKAFKPVDKQKVFESMINEEIIVDPTDGQRRVKRGLVTEKDAKWNDLSENEKDLVKYMREQMKDIVNHVLISGPNAVVSERNGKKRTKLDVYNEDRGAFKMSDDFIPKVGITSSEVRFKAKNDGFDGAKNYVRHQLAKRLSMFYEENVEGDNQMQYGIPVKYLGTGASIHNPDTHTSNLEVAFKTFMQHMVNKKHYDSVYAMGDSVKGFLEIQKDVNGNLINKNAAEFLGYHMHKNLIGRIDDKGDGFWRKGFRLGVSSDGKDINFSPIKFIRTLNSGVAAAALWAKVPSAAKNAGQALWAVSKESLVSSIGTADWKFGNLGVDKQDLSAKNHAKAYSLWMDYQKASMLGKGKEHPVHVFMKSFRMYPEMTELGNRREYKSDGGTAYNLNHLSVLYSYPEQMTTAVLGMDAMMTMKIQTGPYQGQSMWDVYSKNIVSDPITGEGKFELPSDFTRGKLRMGDGSLQELKGLNFLEIQKLHRIVQRVKGGYRTEERSMIESTAIGEVFMLFRRWLPACIVNGFKSKQYDPSMGYLAKTDNEDEFEWQARMTEGRWRTMAGFMGQVTGLATRRGYQWEDMSDLQKRNILDFAVTYGTFATMSALTAALFGDVDDEDSLKKWTSEMNKRIIEQWNFVEMIKSATNAPAAVRAALELLDGGVQLGMASAAAATGQDDEAVFTRRGDLRGVNKLLKNLPVSASIYDAEKFIENMD